VRERDRVQLLSGPYTPPALRRGDRTSCLFRDADVVITSWTAAPIPWPRCRRLECGGGSGLLVTEELVRARGLSRTNGRHVRHVPLHCPRGLKDRGAVVMAFAAALPANRPSPST
jgi:hypothetical protein